MINQNTPLFFFLQSSLIIWATDYTEFIHLQVTEHLFRVGHCALGTGIEQRIRQTWCPYPSEAHGLVGGRKRKPK